MSGETILNNRYRLVAQQGSGGMAVIYKAIDQSLGRTVAVKILRPSLTTDPAFIIRFQNEARSIANLQHPNIVTVHDVGTDVSPRGTTHYIVMEFVDGQDLKKVVRAEAPVKIDRVLHYAIQICAGIGFAHRAGIVHADVKPQNILLTRDGIVKVTDFGIAQALSDTQPQQRESVVWGSPHYFAPEQARGEKPTAASDVYSIGIVMFEMLTGRLPYMGTNQQELAMAHIKERVPLVTEFNPSVPEDLARIVYKIMSKESSNRYRMADQLGHILINYRDRGRDRTMNAPAAAPPRPDSMPQQPVEQSRPAPAPVGPAPGAMPPRPPSRPPSVPAQVQPPFQQQPGIPPLDSSPLRTQRYSPAPDAPYQPPQVRPPAPGGNSQRPSPPSQQGYGVPQPQSQGYGASPSSPLQRGDSVPFDSRYMLRRQEADEAFRLDGVTIALALLAFLSVACLIPLYIAVFQARLGG
jgi:eukaryotic-like serine/threonine-protein kinase